MAAEERWVGVEDVAAHLGVAKDSVYRWINEKGLPAHRVGRLFRFKFSEVDEWVKKSGDKNIDIDPPHKEKTAKSVTRRPKTKKPRENG